MSDKDAETWARQFHEAYERLAPSFGYETRADTKAFDPTSPNGRLMTAVCGEVCSALIAAAKATTSAEQRAVEARAELEQLAQSPDGRRQIDMLAAERVMGWVRRTRADVYQERTDDPEVPDGEWYAALGNEWWARDGDKWKDVAYVEDEGCCREDYEQGWRPTTSIADAWQLVEKMRADDYDVQVTARRWTTTCYIEQYESIKAVITNDTAPLAITIAAILAGGEKEKA